MFFLIDNKCEKKKNIFLKRLDSANNNIIKWETAKERAYKKVETKYDLRINRSKDEKNDIEEELAELPCA